jgi:hypothetical protein
MRICSRAAGVAFSALLVTGPLAAQGFEGSVTYKLPTAKKGTGEMVQHYKGSRVRMEGMGREGGAMIMDATAGTMMMIMPSEKMYMTMDLKGHMGNDKADPKDAKVTPLGTKETIAGRSCENYLVGDKQEDEICVAKGMGFFLAGTPSGPMGGSMRGGDPTDLAANPELRKMFKDGFFPLRISKIKGGKREVEMEATLIEPKTLDASLFEPPAGYKEMKMPGGMGMPRRP